MANQTAIKLHTQPGEQLIAINMRMYIIMKVEELHLIAVFLLFIRWNSRNDYCRTSAINDPSFISPLTSLVCVENTTNKGGGALL
jgi:threonine aldolase